MSYKKLIFLLFCCNTINLYAENNYVDNLHNTMSDTVFTLSKSIDKLLSGDYKNLDVNTNKHDIENNEQSIDSFFKTKKYLDETEKTFLQVNFNTLLQTKDSNKFGYRIKARLPLSRTKKNYNLFIDELTNEKPNSEITNQSTNPSKTSVGINYFAAATYGIDSKYSIGIRGIHPFIRARYNLNYSLGSWKIEPVQTFKYSSNKKFEEETSIYFDKKITNLSLLRFFMHRHTQEKIPGMNYTLSAQYFHPLENNIALSISQSVSGNTKYEDFTYFPNNTSTSTTYGGINNYATSLNWRQNIWKKWFFYEVAPGINFHRQYDYKVNYSVRFSIDMYFGQTYKKQVSSK